MGETDSNGRNPGHSRLVYDKEKKTLITVDPNPGPDKPGFTPQQITDHCEKIDSLGCNGDNDRDLLFESMVIIRQLVRSKCGQCCWPGPD